MKAFNYFLYSLVFILNSSVARAQDTSTQIADYLAWVLQNARNPEVSAVFVENRRFWIDKKDTILTLRSTPIDLVDEIPEAKTSGRWLTTSKEMAEWHQRMTAANPRPSEWKAAYAKLNQTDRRQLIGLMGSHSIRELIAGTHLYVGAAFFISTTPSVAEAEVYEAFDLLKNSTSARFNGQTYEIEFDRPNEKANLDFVAALISEPQYEGKLKSYFSSHPDFLADHNDTEVGSRLEPIDLLSHSLRKQVEDRLFSSLELRQSISNLNATDLNRLIKLALQNKWQPGVVNVSEIPQVQTVQADTGNEVLIFCANFPSRLEMDLASQSLLTDTVNLRRPLTHLQAHLLRLDRAKLQTGTPFKFTFTCGDQTYDGSIRAEAGTKIEIKEEDRKLPQGSNILMTFGLTPDVPTPLREAMKVHLQEQGWKLTKESDVVLTVEGMMKRLEDVDVLVPVAHRIDAGRLQFGFSKSVELEFERSSEQKVARLSLLVPSAKGSKNDELIADRVGIIKAFQNRNLKHPGKLLIFNMTCRGASVIPAWMSIYHSAVESAGTIEERPALPLILGTEIGFRAENFAQYQILAGFFDSVANSVILGKSLNELVGSLNAPVDTEAMKLPNGFAAITNVDGKYSVYLDPKAEFQIELKLQR